jgi:thiamine kinase-like enzyme
MSKTPLQRWKHSFLYPAFRPPAKFYRMILRTKALMGIGKTIEAPQDEWMLSDFLADILPEIHSTVLLMGTISPAQKVIVQLWNENKVVGYIKYAENPRARVRLNQEYQMLSSLPINLAPKPIKYDVFLNGLALVTEPILGKMLCPCLPPPPAVGSLLKTLTLSRFYSIENHPWVKKLEERNLSRIEPWITALTTHKWPIAINHGDFAPWNIFHIKEDLFSLVDWEYGNINGFPYIDLAYYLLQVAMLIYRWPPSRAKAYAINYICHSLKSEVSPVEAKAIINITAYNAYQQAKADGHSANEPIQVYRSAIWKEES